MADATWLLVRATWQWIRTIWHLTSATCHVGQEDVAASAGGTTTGTSDLAVRPCELSRRVIPSGTETAALVGVSAALSIGPNPALSAARRSPALVNGSNFRLDLLHGKELEERQEHFLESGNGHWNGSYAFGSGYVTPGGLGALNSALTQMAVD